MIFFENLNILNSEFKTEFYKKVQNFYENKKYILGSELEKFEKNFSHFIKIKNSIGVGNCLDALTMSLKVLNFEKNSEIIVAANAYFASILSIINAGYKPVLVDPDIKTYNIDANKIKLKITRKTKAILAVHLYGKCCDMVSIKEICKNYSLKLIEDCAQSHGAKFNNQLSGTFGDLSCFSFYPTKILGGIGDGGIVCSNSYRLINKIRKFRNYGSLKRYCNDLIGVNSRLDDIQAVFLDIKLKHIKKIIKKKRDLASIYFNNLDRNKFILPDINKDYFDVHYIFPIRHPKRKELINYLNKKGITTDIHYPIPPYKQKALKNYFDEKFSISDKIHNEILSLPISYIHNEKQILKVCKILNKF